MRLKECVTAVTGAASGIGRALCCLAGDEGARLILVDRDREGLASLAEELTAAGVRHATEAVDVRDRTGLTNAIQSRASELGPVDLLVACAGIAKGVLVDDFDVEELEIVTRVNFLGTLNAIDAVLPQMLQRRHGQIVAISSLQSYRGMPFGAAYGASKAALSTYLESIRPPLRKRGVFVTTVCPSFVRTPLVANVPGPPPRRMMDPRRAARHVREAIRRRSRVYAFPWHADLAMHGLTWLPPTLYDWLMTRLALTFLDPRY